MMAPNPWLHAARRCGLAGLMGLALLGGAAWAHWAWLPAQRAEVDQLASQVRRTRHELLAASAPPSSPQDALKQPAVGSPQQAWQGLWQSLPTSDERVALQAQVLDKAKAHGLGISAVQYQGSRQTWAAQAQTVLWRQRMVMPVEGGHAAVHAWLADLLKEPSLSIDSVELQRSDVMSDQVKARVSVSLWWRRLDKPAAQAQGSPS